MIKFLIISILLLTTIHSDSIENYLDESLVDCQYRTDEYKDYVLKFIKK